MERTRHYQTATKDVLSERQREVLALISAGMTNPEIAEKLGITLDGAKFHVREILSKLEVDSREEAAEWWKAQRGISGRLANFVRALLPGSWLKPLAASTALGVAALGAVVVTMAVNGGSSSDDGHHDSALADMRRDCDPNILKWRVESVLDPRLGMRFVMTAAVGGECVLDTDVTLYAYGMTDQGAGTGLVGIGQPIVLALGPQIIGNSETPVVVGTVSNVCGESERVLLIMNSPNPEQFMIDRAYLLPCTAAGQPAAFEAKWAPEVSALNPVVVPAMPAAFQPCDPMEVSWRASTTLDPQSGMRFDIYAASPIPCLFTSYVYVSALVELPGSPGLVSMLATTPTALAVRAQSLGPKETQVVSGTLANVCESNKLALQLSGPGFSNCWLDVADVPPCVSPGRPVELSAVFAP